MVCRKSLGGLVRVVGVSLVVLMGAPRLAASETLEVEARATWMTAAQPEIHLLLQGGRTQTRVLAVYLPERVTCDGKEAARSEKRKIFDTLSRLPFALTTGELRPDSWLHRSFPVGGYWALNGECIATYRVADWSSGKVLASGEISIPSTPSPHVETSASKDSIGVSVQVERDSRFPELYLVKLLVRNREDHAVLVSQSDRRLACGAGTTVESAYRPDVIQGEDSGPVWIPKRSWAVLQDAVTVRAGSIIGCTVDAELAAYRVGEGLVPVKRVREKITEAGELRRIVHGGPE